MIKVIIPKKINFQTQFFVSMSVLALLVGLSFYNLYRLIDDQKEYAYLINLSGKQRMQTEQIFLKIHFLEHNDSDAMMSDIQTIAHKMANDYRKLSDKLRKIGYSESIVYTNPTLPDPLRELYSLSNATMNATADEQIMTSHTLILNLFDDATRQLQNHSDALNQQTIWMGGVLLVINLGMIGMITLFIFRPILQWLRQKHRMIRELNTKLEEKISHRTKRLNKTLDIINQYVYTTHTNTNGVITYASDAFCDLCGYSKEELIGQTHRLIKHPDNPSSAFAPLWKTLFEGKPYHGTVKNRRKNGEDFWLESYIVPDIDDEGEIIGFQAFRINITDKKNLETLNEVLEEKVQKRTMEIERLAITDPLTGLHNRHRFNQELKEAIAFHKRYEYSSIVLMIADIDHFKLINDKYGHNIGDSVLKEFGSLLLSAIRETDKVARWGGEEFVFLLYNTDLENSFVVTNNLLKMVREHSFKHVGRVTCSMGLTLLHHQDSSEIAMERADKALYHAKSNGRDQVCS